MRGALENFATAAWLLDGPDRPERRCRTLRLWRQDMRNRAQHEEETDHTPGTGGRMGVAPALGLETHTSSFTTTGFASPSTAISPATPANARGQRTGYTNVGFKPRAGRLRCMNPQVIVKSWSKSAIW